MNASTTILKPKLCFDHVVLPGFLTFLPNSLFLVSVQCIPDRWLVSWGWTFHLELCRNLSIPHEAATKVMPFWCEAMSPPCFVAIRFFDGPGLIIGGQHELGSKSVAPLTKYTQEFSAIRADLQGRQYCIPLSSFRHRVVTHFGLYSLSLAGTPVAC